MYALIISGLEDQHIQQSNGNSDQLLTVFGASFWHYDNKSLVKLNISTKQVLVWRWFANIHMYAEVKPNVGSSLMKRPVHNYSEKILKLRVNIFYWTSAWKSCF